MTLINWTKAFALGHHEIDQQHRNLVLMINGLHHAMMNGESAEALDALFHNLIQDAQTHFETEERLMQDCQYPGYAQHRLEHEEFLRTARDLRSRHRTGEIFLHIETLQFLVDWLARHDLDRDREFIHHVRNQSIQQARKHA